MFLSSQTYEGLQVTVHSFKEVWKFLIEHGVQYIPVRGEVVPPQTDVSLRLYGHDTCIEISYVTNSLTRLLHTLLQVPDI